MTKVIYVHGCSSFCPYDNRDEDWKCSVRDTTVGGIPKDCKLPDAPKVDSYHRVFNISSGKIEMSCVAGPLCNYLTIGSLLWGCNLDGDCEFQRPRISERRGCESAKQDI